MSGGPERSGETKYRWLIRGLTIGTLVGMGIGYSMSAGFMMMLNFQSMRSEVFERLDDQNQRINTFYLINEKRKSQGDPNVGGSMRSKDSVVQQQGEAQEREETTETD